MQVKDINYMLLNSLSILNYKNIKEANLTFSSKINCFIGNNGMGKTNILDAIYFLSFCKSHSCFSDTQNINHDADFFMIQGKYSINNEDEEIFCGMKRKQKKQFKRSNKEYERLSDHIGLIPLVMVSPDDSKLITEGSSERRKFIDGVISQFNKTYLQHLLQYNYILKQRNSLLKQEHPDDQILDILEDKMDFYGQYIYQERVTFIESFIPVFQEFYQKIAAANETVSLKYLSDYQMKKNMVAAMKENRYKDKILGFSTIGIHKDDLEMHLENYPIKQIGSQGQNKTYLISLKFAQFDFLKKIHKMYPILLLDDIFDKLDSIRVEQIVKLVASDFFGQIFITDTNREHLDHILLPLEENNRIYKVVNGDIE